MLTVYSDSHTLRDSKTDLYGGELVYPDERPTRVEYIDIAEIGLNTVNVLQGFEGN